MQNKHNTTRRDILKAAAVLGAGTVAGAAGGVAHEIASGKGAAAYMDAWKEAACAMLKAERESSRTLTASELKARNLPALPSEPDGFPDPAKYAGKEAKAEYIRAIENGFGRGIGLAAIERLEEEGSKSPEYRAAVANYKRRIADHEAAIKQRAEQERSIKKRCGHLAAERAATTATRAFCKAQEAVLTAPIHSEADALAVLTVMLFAVDVSCGVFDGGTDEDFGKVDIQNTLRRLRPFLPASPASQPKHWLD